MPQHQGLQSSSHRNTQFFSIFAKSPPPTFLPLNVSFGRKQTFQTIISKLFYHTIRKGKLSFPLWEIFVLQTTVVFDTNTLFYNKSKSSKDGNTAPARILQLQSSQSILHFIPDVITISLSKIIKFDLSSD